MKHIKVKRVLLNFMLFALIIQFANGQQLRKKTYIKRSATTTSSVYALPFKAEDLRPGERYSTGDHSNSNPGQALGEDFGAKRYLGNNQWSGLKKGKDGEENIDYIVYNKPFYAIEDGEVCGCWQNAPENPEPGEHHEALDQNIIPRGGNHIWVLQDNGVYVLYAHAIPGTIPESICPNNDEFYTSPDKKGYSLTNPNPNTWIPKGQRVRIKKGQFLGRAGNSGSSSHPHLHLHAQTETQSAPMKFERGMTSAFNGVNKADINKWTKLKGKEIPDGNVLVWPPRSVSAEYTRHGFRASNFQRMFDHLADSGYELSWLDGYSVANKTYFNFSWRPASGRPWKAFFGLSSTAYQNAFNRKGSLSPIFLDSYKVGRTVRYNVIFQKKSGNSLARHGMNYTQHRAVMSEAKRKGLEPVNISVVSINNQLKYAALYRKMNYGGWKIKSQVKASDYQKLFTDYKALGFTPVYLNGYKHNGQGYLTTVFARNAGGALRARHGMSRAQVQTEWQSAMNAGYRTKMITAFDGSSKWHLFAGLWEKEKK